MDELQLLETSSVLQISSFPNQKTVEAITNHVRQLNDFCGFRRCKITPAVDFP